MIRRPMVIGAVFLVVVLLIGRWTGVPWASPFPEQVGGQVRILGRICNRERTARGTRLYIDSFSFLSSSSPSSEVIRSDSISGEVSDPGSIHNKDRDNKILVYLKADTGTEYRIGSWILTSGKYDLPDRASNPGQFDSRKYYRARKVMLILREAVILDKDENVRPVRNFLTVCREKLSASIHNILGKAEAGLLAAMVTGDRTAVDSDVKRLYQEGGIAHILAISSLHITLLGQGIYRLLRRQRCSFIAAAMVSASLIWGFAVMAGLSVSAVRASLMFCIWLGSQIAGRTNDGLTSAAAAVFVILLNTSEYLEDGSFLLSIACILSIFCVSPMFSDLLPLPGNIGKPLQLSAAVQMGTLPVTMNCFYQVTPYAVLANLIVLPFLSLIMVTGLLAGAVGCISIPAGTLMAAPCYYLLKLFEHICLWERKLPGAVVITGKPEVWQGVLYYMILAGICVRHARHVQGKNRISKSGGTEGRKQKCEKKRKKQNHRRWKIGQRTAEWLLLIMAVGILSFRTKPQLRLTFLDVGQGDGILIEADGYAFLVDGGSSSVDDVWQYRIEQTLKYYGISELDAIFLSHGDEDHISGTRELLEAYERNHWGQNIGGITLKRLFLPDIGYEDEKLEKLRNMARTLGITTADFPAGGQVFAGGLTLLCLHPDESGSIGDKNEDSMVLRLEYGDFSALFTGDMGMEGEQRFLEYCRAQYGETGNRSITILKVGHHGSKYATSEELLSQLRPDYAVISCGENNSYGHPAEETLQRLENAGVTVLRTDQSGAVTITYTSSEQAVRIRTAA